jgi:hypothetical protein
MVVEISSLSREERDSRSRIRSTNPNNPGYTLTTNYGKPKGLLDENINQKGVQRYHDKNTGYIGTTTRILAI